MATTHHLDRGEQRGDPPMFSVCVAVRDRAEFLVEAVRSVLASDYSDYELLIVDDGSARPVSKTLADAGILAGGISSRGVISGGISDAGTVEPRIRVIEQEPAGIAAARNTALEAATGEFITVLDSDDELVPDGLTRLARLLTASAADTDLGPVDWIYADYEEHVGERQTVIRLPGYSCGNDLCRAVLSRPRLPFKHSGMTVRRELLQRLGGYNERLSIKVDVELMLRALRAGVQPRHLSFPVVRFRRHGGNVSRGRLAGLRVWLQLIDEYGPPSTVRRAGIKAVRTGSELGKWLVSTVR